MTTTVLKVSPKQASKVPKNEGISFKETVALPRPLGGGTKTITLSMKKNPLKKDSKPEIPSSSSLAASKQR